MTCNQAADCAPEQVCGADGYCAAADIAGTCAKLASSDAGTDAPKPPGDAPMPMPDARPTVRLHVQIDGRGTVTIPTVGDCDSGTGQMDCYFDIPKSVPITLNATPKNMWFFDKWDDACKDTATSSCILAPMADTKVKAVFKMEQGDD